ncbi:hypothetical protein [Ramlibacter montanisoli]|uniref:Uncharacterized protein n=1 Tax=Ramlibacter montanisoli TaxID=2732512 RepID=A0A849K936_9BURK|nr:hypothetical protein [Ramlibacter montanisoli]NNU44838.1 hypothetical protein [Ramlibacter montanisoli]
MPDRKIKPSGAPQEFEVAYYTKELGKTLQRQMLEQQLARFSENGNAASRHGEDAAPVDDVTPQEDRAG